MKINYEKGFVHWILIVIGILIVLVLVGYFTTDRDAVRKDTGSTPRASQQDCGLIVDSPKENALVVIPVAVSGYLKSCDTTPITSERGTVHLIDATGAVLGPEVDLQLIGNWIGRPAHFSVIVPATTKPQTSNGFLVFINHSQDGKIINAFQVPILFAN